MQKLKQSILTPPGWVFGVVWPILYTMLGIYSWLLSEKRKTPEYNDLYHVAWLQMIINWTYMPVFFYLHLLVSAELVLILIVGFTGYMITKLWIMKAYKLSLLIIPYFIWCSFATYLSTMLIILN
jgi:tryptophan-rich sensory protein